MLSLALRARSDPTSSMSSSLLSAGDASSTGSPAAELATGGLTALCSPESAFGLACREGRAA